VEALADGVLVNGEFAIKLATQHPPTPRLQPTKSLNNFYPTTPTLVVSGRATIPQFNNLIMKSKKELKEEYKNKLFPMGVYQIRNSANGKIFVGSSTNLNAIWNRHLFQLNMGSHRNASLQQDWKTFGEDAFVYEILDEIEPEEGKVVDYKKEVLELEEMYVENLQPFGDRGYN
jgi:hypothetical protein